MQFGMRFVGFAVLVSDGSNAVDDIADGGI
jgi:hypothetical protein